MAAPSGVTDGWLVRLITEHAPGALGLRTRPMIEGVRHVKTLGLLTISAVPGIAFAYVILTGLLLRRVRPLPIVLVPPPAG